MTERTHQEIATQNTVLLTEVGSRLFGVSNLQSDTDLMGVCIEPPEYVIGLSQFEQYNPQSKIQGERSGPDDVDLTIYSLRKWSRLAAKGNPSVLLLLFVPEDRWIKAQWPAYSLQDNAELFISQDCTSSFIGYLNSQYAQMMNLKGKHTNRPELIEQWGWDLKFGYHAVRLGLQGVELLTTGKITLPIPEPDRSWLIQLRNGQHTKDEALERILDCRAELDRLAANTDLPAKADTVKINKWLIEIYQRWWEN